MEPGGHLIFIYLDGTVANQSAYQRNGRHAADNIPGLLPPIPGNFRLQHHRGRLRLFHAFDNLPAIRHGDARGDGHTGLGRRGAIFLPFPLAGSSSSERWTTTSASGTVSSSGTITTQYFHQYLTTVSYAVIDGGTPGAPAFTAAAFGTPLTQTLTPIPQGLWIDSSTAYSITGPLTGTTSTERWQPAGSLTGNIGSSSTINIAYEHQYYITINHRRRREAPFHRSTTGITRVPLSRRRRQQTRDGSSRIGAAQDRVRIPGIAAAQESKQILP